MEKTGEPWTPSITVPSPTSVEMSSNNNCGRREGWVGMITNPQEYTYEGAEFSQHALHAK